MADRRVFDCWVVVRPAEDIPGEWVAHCLDLDVVTQGSNPAHAFEMAHEAAAMTVAEDLNSGRDPLRRRAPEESWTELFEMLVESSPIDQAAIAALVGPAILIANMLIDFEQLPAHELRFQVPLSVLVADKFLRQQPQA